MAKKLHRQGMWEFSSGGDLGEPDGEARAANSKLAERLRIERARRLIADSNYPSEEIIQTLAELLARHWYV